MKNFLFRTRTMRNSALGVKKKSTLHVVAFLFVVGMDQLWAGLPTATCEAKSGEMPPKLAVIFHNAESSLAGLMSDF